MDSVAVRMQQPSLMVLELRLANTDCTDALLVQPFVETQTNIGQQKQFNNVGDRHLDQLTSLYI